MTLWAQSGKVEGVAKIIILAFRDYFQIAKIKTAKLCNQICIICTSIEFMVIKLIFPIREVLKILVIVGILSQ